MASIAPGLQFQEAYNGGCAWRVATLDKLDAHLADNRLSLRRDPVHEADGAALPDH